MLTTETIKSVVTTTTAQAVFNALSQRERPRTLLNLELFYESLTKTMSIDEKEFWGLFKKLEEHKIGHIVKDKGQPTYFQWYFNLLDVAAMAIGSSDTAPRRMSAPLKVPKDVVQKYVDSISVKKPVVAKKPRKIEVIGKKPGSEEYITINIPLNLLKNIR